MDIDLFRDGEQFSTFDSHSFLDPDDSTSLDNMHNFSSNELFEWNLDSERELNGDLSVIPVSSDYCDISRVNDTSSCKEDFQKIMNEWQQLINLETTCDEFTIEDPIITPEENEHETLQQKCSLHEILDIPNPKNFDLTTYLNDEPIIPVQNAPVKKQKAPVKKIDLKAQRYIIDDDEDDVDVETISEADENSPVLEAGDLNTLLEQFEATEMPDLSLPNNCIESNVKEVSNEKCSSGLAQLYNIKQELTDYDEYNKELSHRIKQEIHDDVNIAIKQECIDIGEVELLKKEPKPEPLKHKRQARSSIDTIKKEVKIEPRVDISKVKEELSPSEVKGKQNEQVKSIKKEKVPHPGQTKQATHCYPKNEITLIKTPPPKHFNPLKPSAITTPSTSRRPPDSTTSCTPDTKIKDSKQILDSLPQELIARIKESNKRKPISVIPPIPSKRPKNDKHVRCTSNAKSQDATPKPPPPVTSPPSIFESSVRLDHDYCGRGPQASKDAYPVSKLAEPYPEHPKKDSGFGSGEEEDRAVVIGKQPTVKNADGKLMVSLLKVNTIHTNETKKRKLNLEEYKKRREGFAQSQNNSQNCSPISSASSSPSPEDENAKRIKHQEKLMKMALEVLNTPPKSDKRSEPPIVVAPPQPVQIPANMEKKTLVSIGVNTDFKIRRNLDPLAPVEQLEEIKPLLKTAKISSNSLITSLIENIPRVIDSCDPEHSCSEPTNKTEHGEDKTIVYLPKNRATIKTSSVSCQTNISLIQQTKASRYRRRRNSSNSSSGSSSSGSSSKQSRRRSSHVSRNSSSSRSSFSRSTSTTYSSRSSSRSRSRSPSPKYSRKERERLREVEERRVIYVGHLSPATSRDDLRKRFQRFGPITNVSLHQRDNAYKDNYGFVTFANKLDAYEALEHGNDDPYQPKYDLSFGGRRIFCKTTYSDLDNMHEEAGYYPSRMIDNSFDTLLREMQEKLCKRKA